MSLNTWKELIIQIQQYNMCEEDIKCVFLIFSASASHSLLALGFFSDLTDIINVQGSKLNHVESFSLYLSIFLLLIFKADADLLVQLFRFSSFL